MQELFLRNIANNLENPMKSRVYGCKKSLQQGNIRTFAATIRTFAGTIQAPQSTLLSKVGK
jgi:hypothetical protein